MRKLRQLIEENALLIKLVADLSLDKQMLQDAIKEIVKPSNKRRWRWLVDNYPISNRRACVRLDKSPDR